MLHVCAQRNMLYAVKVVRSVLVFQRLPSSTPHAAPVSCSSHFFYLKKNGNAPRKLMDEGNLNFRIDKQPKFISATSAASPDLLSVFKRLSRDLNIFLFSAAFFPASFRFCRSSISPIAVERFTLSLVPSRQVSTQPCAIVFFFFNEVLVRTMSPFRTNAANCQMTFVRLFFLRFPCAAFRPLLFFFASVPFNFRMDAPAQKRLENGNELVRTLPSPPH